jgi:hypothetical protein
VRRCPVHANPMPAMRVADFMPILQERTLALLSNHLRDGLTPRIRTVWFQLHYHTPKVHYEVWLTRKTKRIEIGLHFEGPRDFSYRWAELMSAHAPEIFGRLGPDVEIEEWTPSWTRIHQSLPYDPLSEPLADEIAHRLAEMISVLQPIVESERDNVPPELERTTEANGRQPRRRFERKKATKTLRH